MHIILTIVFRECQNQHLFYIKSYENSNGLEHEYQEEEATNMYDES